MSNENPETAKIFLNLEAPTGNLSTMSTGGEGFEQNQPAAPVRPQSINTSGGVASGPMIVALIAILGGGSIFGMRVVSKHAAIAAESFVLDYTPPAIGTDFDSRFEITMLNLERSTRPVQVPYGYLTRDPFEFSQTRAIVAVPDEPVQDVDLEEIKRLRELALAASRKAARERQEMDAMTKAAGHCQLQSTLQGSNPVARISGEIVRVGGTFAYQIDRGDDGMEDAFFHIESINGRSVILVGPDGSRFEISIGMPFRELEPVASDEPDASVEADSDKQANAETSKETSEKSSDAGEPVAEPAQPKKSFMERLHAASKSIQERKKAHSSGAAIEGTTPEADAEATEEAAPAVKETPADEADKQGADETESGASAESQAQDSSEESGDKADDSSETDDEGSSES